MAIVQISRITQRKGLQIDLPQLAGAEFGWSVDSRRLFIGNGTLAEGAPVIGNTEILTEFSDILSFQTTYTYKGEAAGYVVQTGPSSNAPVTLSLQNWMDQWASVKDFGAMGDGVTDDAPSINAAIAQLLNGYPQSGNLAVTLYFPPGNYIINSTILLYPFITIQGAGVNCTSITAMTGTDMLWMFETADSLGQTGANIGLNNTTLPKFINISDLMISTNDQLISAFNCVRYLNICIKDCYMIGGWNSTLAPGTDAALSLLTIGNTINSSDFRVFNTTINNFSNAILAPDPVSNTFISFSNFTNLWRGINLANPNFGGPHNMCITNSALSSIADYAIYNGSQHATVSTNNFYSATGGIYWASTSSKNVSMGEVFDVLIGVTDAGSSNSIILNPGQSNLP